MQKKLLIYGGAGLVGSRLKVLLSKSFIIFAPTHRQSDITKKVNIRRDIDQLKPDIIINAAGVTSFREAELDLKKANNLNFLPSKLITDYIGSKPISYFLISTDAVFGDDNKGLPHKETDVTDPLTIYGKTKLMGEKVTLQYPEKNGVIRIIRPYTLNFPTKTDMVRMCLESFQREEVIEAITDQVINPLFVDDVVKAIEKILIGKKYGIFHVAALDSMSSYEFIKLIALTFKYDPKLVLKTNLLSFQKNSKVQLANNCVLDVGRFNKEFGKLPTMAESLINYKKEVDLL